MAGISLRRLHLYQSGEPLQLILAASGSEVSLALKAAHLLEEGVAVRVVSIPCAEVFYAQDEGYRRSVLPDGLPIMVVEAGVTRGWYSLKPGAQITVYGIDRFGVSGPGDEVAAKLGLHRRCSCSARLGVCESSSATRRCF